MSDGVRTGVTAILSVSLFLIGMATGVILITSQSQYVHCSSLHERRTINYSGSIDEYEGTGITPDFYFGSDSGSGGVLLLSSDRLAVDNGSRLQFTFQHDIWIECEDERIQIDTHILNEEFRARVGERRE